MTKMSSCRLSPIKRLFRKIALNKIAKSLVRTTQASRTAGDEVLYRLPGVFSMRIEYKDSFVRLIKEANELRIMENSEKSEVLLSVTIADKAALGDLAFRSATWQKVYAEGRLTFGGKEKYASLLIRIAAEGDKLALDPGEYQNLYGE